jgi:hypothetical protein
VVLAAGLDARALAGFSMDSLKDAARLFGRALQLAPAAEWAENARMLQQMYPGA